MKTEPRKNRIDYVEFPSASRESHAATKKFYGDVFDWSYQSWGDDYSDTKGSGINSGISSASEHRPAKPLVVLYASNLEAVRERVIKAGGKISKEIFSFPGGRRFQFIDPSGNELGVWSDKVLGDGHH
jgi:predicted enzyme related to lactoylglutathione lyase